VNGAPSSDNAGRRETRWTGLVGGCNKVEMPLDGFPQFAVGVHRGAVGHERSFGIGFQLVVNLSG